MNLQLPFASSIIVFIYTILVYFFKLYLVLFCCYEYVKHFSEGENQEVYDYVIVGSGTAGSLIAHHLSAHHNIKFLVLEAGGSGGPLLNPPALGPLLQGTSYDWQYEAIEQSEACLAMSGKCKWPSGKIVGGSAKLNNMIYMRGYVEELVPWFNGKYSAAQLNSYLDELEKTDLFKESLNFKTSLPNAVLNAARELGFKTDDTNELKLGFMETIVSQRNGARWSTSHLLQQNLKNGKLISNAFVQKIVMDFENKNAKGVFYEKFGKIHYIQPKKGVILASGAIGTPKILLLSGIGPQDHLQKLKIPVIKNLPVGNNLMDHVTTGLDLILLSKPLDFNLANFSSPISAWNYFIHGTGPWTFVGCEAIAILNTCNMIIKDKIEYCNKNSNLPDLQLMIMPTGISADSGVYLRKTLGISDLTWDYYFQKIINMNSISILPVVLHPKSVGYMQLYSSNPSDLPLIQPNYFSHPDDVKVIINGINLIKQLINTSSMKKLGAHLNTNLLPGCMYTEFDTPDYWECYIKHLTLSSYHPAGTCQMGDPLKNTTVVDFNFKVSGINNLYVADASLFPTMPSGNINTAVLLLAKIFSTNLIVNEMK